MPSRIPARHVWAVVVLAMLLLAVFLQPIGRFALGRLLGYAGRALHGEVSFRQIEGDVYSRPVVRGLKFVIGQDSLVAERVSLSYNPLGFLRGRFAFSNVEIAEPTLYLASRRPAAARAVSAPAKKPASYPRVALSGLRLLQGAVFIDTVCRVDSIDVYLWLIAGGRQVAGRLEDARAFLVRESVDLRKLSGAARLTTDSLLLTGLTVATRASRAQASLGLKLDGGDIAVRLDSLTVSLDEFTDLPGVFRARGSAGIQRGLARARLGYAATGFAWRQLNLPSISGHVALADSVVRLNAAGQSAELGQASIEGSLDLRDLSYHGVVEANDVPVRSFEPTLPDLRVSLSAEAGGRKFDSVGARVGTSIVELGIESLQVDCRYQAGAFRVERLDASGPCGHIRAAGWYSDKTLSADCVVESLDLAYVGRALGQQLDGRVSGTARLSGRSDSFELSGGLRGSGLAFAGGGARTAVVDFDAGFGRVIWGRVAVGVESLSVGTVTADAAQFLWNEPEFEIRIDLPRNRLRALGEASLARSRVAANVTMLEFATERETLTTTQPFTLNWSAETLAIQGVTSTVAGGTFDLDLRLAGQSLPQVNLKVQRLDLAKVHDLVGLGPEMSGMVDLEARGQDTMHLQLDGQGVAAPSLGLSLQCIELSMDASRSETRIEYLRFCRAAESTAVTETSRIAGKATYDLAVKPFIDGLRFDLTADLRDPGTWVLVFLKQTIDVQQGQIYAQIALRGPFAEPDLSGRVRIARARLLVPSINTAVDRVNTELVLDRDRLLFQKLSGRSSRGAVVGTGFINLGRAWLVDTLHFDIDFTGTTFNPVPEIYAIASGRIALDWANGRPFAVSGDVEATEGLIAIGFGQAAANPSAGPDTTWVCDLHIRGDRGIWLRNSLVDVELGLDLNLRKTRTEEVYSGELASRQGSVYYLDHTLRITRGVLQFENINRINPGLDIVAELPLRPAADSSAGTPEKIILAVTGTLEKPQLEFRSEPPGWTEADVASYLNLNMTPDQISSLEQKGEVTKLLSQRLLGYFQTQVAKRARGFVNLDYLEIESGWLSAGNTRVTVGKYIGRKLYVTYTQNFTGDQSPLFRVEYYLNRKNELVAEGTDQDRYSLRYRFKLRY